MSYQLLQLIQIDPIRTMMNVLDLPMVSKSKQTNKNIKQFTFFIQLYNIDFRIEFFL
jgi:hypothetical protein